VAAEDEAIECNGHYFKERTDAARCWIYRERYKFTTHTKSIGGPLGIEQAMARSCNIYFYTLAERLGAERLCDWYRRFGLGRLGGDVPSAETARALESRSDRFSTVSLGIGQGAMTVTPLEVAAAYAMVARGGSWIEPTWHKGGGRVAAVQPFSSTAVSRVLRGLEQVTSESYGTGNHMDHGGGVREPIIDAPGARWWIKTGTAEAPSLRLDRDGDGVVEKTVTDADHAWCAGVVGSAIDGVPRYAIAVIVEHGGGGGRTAGPVMAAVIRALVEEGYVGSARASRAEVSR
jgi:penicillin-binding protein 2